MNWCTSDVLTTKTKISHHPDENGAAPHGQRIIRPLSRSGATLSPETRSAEGMHVASGPNVPRQLCP